MMSSEWNCARIVNLPSFDVIGKHKHMQALKKPRVEETDEPSSYRFFLDTEDSNIRVPYLYLHHDFGQSGRFDAFTVHEIYLDMLVKCKTLLGLKEEVTVSLCPHNLVLTKEWMIVIPRRSNDYNGVGANAIAVMEMLVMAAREILRMWIDNGPARVLRELGVPPKPNDEDARA